jgi:hypothetical protein
MFHICVAIWSSGLDILNKKLRRHASHDCFVLKWIVCVLWFEFRISLGHITKGKIFEDKILYNITKGVFKNPIHFR